MSAPREELAFSLGVLAALWGRPLKEYEVTSRVGMNAGAVRVNDLRYYSELKTAKDRFVVTPNNVTIDAYGQADLRTGPVVVAVPSSAASRWTILQIGDMFDEIVHNVGGYVGGQPGLYLLTGPDYHGSVPATMTEIRVRTRVAAVAVRVIAKGEKDIAAAREVQRGFRVMPLAEFQRHGLGYANPRTDDTGYYPEFTPTAPEDLQLFEHIGYAMRLFLPGSADVDDAIVTALRPIGLSVLGGFAWADLDAPTRAGLARAAVAAEDILEDAYASSADIVVGWRYTLADGRAGGDLALRAALAKHVIGGNVAEQLLYPNTAVDADGATLSGANRYELRLAAGTPPVSVLWNLALYGADDLFVENDFGRYSIGSTTDGVKVGPDGEVTIVIQHDRPGDTSNWLPAPAGEFNLTMRLYGADTSVLDGSYRLPGVTRVCA